MKKLLIMLLIISLTLTACKPNDELKCDPGYILVDQECVLDDTDTFIPYDTTKFTAFDDVPLSFTTEPSRYELLTDAETGLNVVYQYDMPVPSFDTWDNLEENRQKIDLNGEWDFTFDNEVLGVENTYYLPNVELQDSFKVPVPSNWDFYNEDESDWYNYQYNEFNKVDEFWNKEYGWYKRTFEVDEDFLNNRFIKLNSLGMTYRAWIFINGTFIEAHDGAYEYFSIDVSEHLKLGENTIAILLHRKPVYDENLTGDTNIDDQIYGDQQYVPHSGIEPWNYGGIHRDIWLESTDQVTISKVLINAHDGILETYTVLYNNSLESRTVHFELYKYSTEVNPSATETFVEIPAQSIKVIYQEVSITEAKEWSYVSPNMYELKVMIREEGTIIDSLHSTYGMRTIKTYSNEIGVADGAGILLNDQEIKLKGFGWNDDFYSEELHSLGNVISEEMYRFQFDTIRHQMDANFLRNLQNDRHPRAYDLMDEYGLMNMQETPFHWLNDNVIQYQLNTYGAMEMMLAVSVWNNMNHPSIIMYSLQNEPTYPESNYMVLATKTLNELVKKIDIQDRLTTVCLRAEGQWWTNIGDHVDVYSFNQKNGALNPSFDIYGDEMNPNLPIGDFQQPLRFKISKIIERYPDLPILFSEPGAWQYNRTDSVTYQMNEYNMMKEQWKIIVEEPEYHSIGFTLFTYNEYKTTHLGSDGDGIAGFGVVPINYSPEYLERMEDFAAILPAIEILGRYFDTLEYGQYAYKEE